jgi:glycosyltransferase involved in cell wall biosynthesis
LTPIFRVNVGTDLEKRPPPDVDPSVAKRIRSLLTLRYPRLEVVLIDDGSTDGTLEVLQAEYDIVPVHAAPLRRQLDAAPVCRIYRSRRTPSLVVAMTRSGFAEKERAQA